MTLSNLQNSPYSYTLTKQNNPDFFTVLHNRNNRYNIGMSSVNHARHIQYSLNPLQPNLRLIVNDKNPRINIGKAIQSELDLEFGNVYFAPKCHLLIDKMTEKQKTYQKDLVKELTYNICLSQDLSSKFILFPLVKETGIILPHTIVEENNNKIVLESNIIFPESYVHNDICKRNRLENLYRNL